jgi:hypothetical protein
MNRARIVIFVVGGLVLLIGAIGAVMFLSQFFVSPLTSPAQQLPSPMPSAQVQYYFQNTPVDQMPDAPRLPIISDEEYDASPLETTDLQQLEAIIENNQGGFGQY